MTNTNTLKLPPESEPLHAAIAETGARVLGAYVDGNGLKADQVRLNRAEVTVHKIPVTLMFRITPELSKATERGNVARGQRAGTAGEVGGRAEGIAQEMVKDPSVQEEIVENIQRDKGQGFGMKQLTIPLSAARQEFSVAVACPKCSGTTMVGCVVCSATGYQNCVNCQGHGTTACINCRGVGRVTDPQTGQQTQCIKCMARGRIMCFQCQGNRQTSCMQCQGQGRVACLECGQSGYFTDIYQVAYKAQGQFDVDWREVAKEARDAVDKLGLRQLATENHAEILWQPSEPRGHDLVYPGAAFLPLAEAEYSIGGGKGKPARVAGLQGRIVEMEPVLDPLVKPGIAALQKLSKGKLAQQALIDTACRYRLVRATLSRLTRHTRKQSYQALVKGYPAVLSDKYARATVQYAYIALESLGAAPRNKGLFTGTGLAALMTGGYFFSPARAQVYAQLASRGMDKFLPAADAAVWLVGAGAAVYMIKSLAASAFSRILPENVQEGEGGKLASAGAQGLAVFPLTGIVYLVIAALAPVRPEWLEALLHFKN